MSAKIYPGPKVKRYRPEMILRHWLGYLDTIEDLILVVRTQDGYLRTYLSAECKASTAALGGAYLSKKSADLFE